MEKKVIDISQQSKKSNEQGSLTLAYVGDAVYELYIRAHIVSKGGRPNALHKKSISYVSAKAQARIIHYLLPNLTEEETNIVKRGRNAKSYTTPKNANVIDYRYSTAFEALIGYLYLSGKIERIEELINLTIKFVEGNMINEQR